MPRGSEEWGLTINSETIKIIGANEVLNPAAVCRNDCGILSVQVWECDVGITKPAVLLAGDVAPINWAIRVILRLGKRKSRMSMCHLVKFSRNNQPSP